MCSPRRSTQVSGSSYGKRAGKRYIRDSTTEWRDDVLFMWLVSSLAVSHDMETVQFVHSTSLPPLAEQPAQNVQLFFNAKRVAILPSPLILSLKH